MNASLRRIGAVFLRYAFLHKRSTSRMLELVFWPVMQLLLWGYVSLYLQSLAEHSAQLKIFVFLINAAIFWDIFFRSQLGVSTSFMEDLWTQNILNLLVSPLRIWEWLAATFLYGLTKTTLITLLLWALAAGLYHFNLVTALGFHLLPLAFNLLIFGWTLGVVASGLLIRWGLSIEGLLWGIPFLFQPVSGVFYPISVLPKFVQAVSLCLPTTYVFEGVRTIIATGALDWSGVLSATLLNAVYFLAAALFFNLMYRRSREKGRLGKLGMD